MNDDRASTRYVALDFYRFVAAFLVVLFHYSKYTDKTWIFSGVDKFGYFVDFFFMLSGYIIFLTYGHKISSLTGYFDFIWRRLARIYPIHVGTLIFYTVILGFINVFGVSISDPAKYNIDALPFQFTLTQVWGVNYGLTFNYPAWSISAEWFLYIIFPFLAILARLNWLLAVAISLVWIGVCVTLIEMGNFADWDVWIGPFALLRAFPLFLLGVTICRCIEMHDLKMPSLIPGVLAFVLAILLTVEGVATPFILAAFAAAVALTAMAERNGATPIFGGAICRSLGDASYAIYMIHAPVATIALQLGGLRFLRLSPAEMVWLALPVALAVIPLASLVHRWFEGPARQKMNAMSPAIRLSWMSRKSY